MPQVSRLFLALCAIVIPLFAAGCGYRFQSAHNPLLDLGIRKIYVAEFRNKTYRPGIEHFFTTAMIREIAHSKSFELTSSKADADAVLSGEVSSAEDSVNATSNVMVGDRPVAIASEYNARVSCSITLTDRRGRKIFHHAVSGNKSHPGSGTLGDAGATAPLNNDSEQRLAVQFLAGEMMASAYQRMIDTF